MLIVISAYSLRINLFRGTFLYLYKPRLLNPLVHEFAGVDMEKNPIKLLQKSTKSLILVKLKNGHEFKGTLEELDNYMNLVLTEAEKIIDNNVVAQYPTVFIRGNNILFIKPKIEKTYPKKA